MKVAIVGYGFVGQATEYFLKSWLVEKLEIEIHDPVKGYNVTDWDNIEYSFICVPTNLIDGSEKFMQYTPEIGVSMTYISSPGINV